MTKTRFLTLVMALALLLAIPTAAFAQRVPPHVFVGSVTLDGATAADGAAVTAWIDGEQVAATTAAGGSYSLIVDQGDSSYAEKTISFKVSGSNADQSATWAQGGGQIGGINRQSPAETIDTHGSFTGKHVTAHGYLFRYLRDSRHSWPDPLSLQRCKVTMHGEIPLPKSVL